MTSTHLTFLVSGTPIMSFTIHEDFLSDITIDNDHVANIILPADRRHYNGLQQEMQRYLDTTKPLPEILDDIRAHGFETPIQVNLEVQLDD